MKGSVSAFWFGRVRLKRRFWRLKQGIPCPFPETRAAGKTGRDGPACLAATSITTPALPLRATGYLYYDPYFITFLNPLIRCRHLSLLYLKPGVCRPATRLNVLHFVRSPQACFRYQYYIVPWHDRLIVQSRRQKAQHWVKSCRWSLEMSCASHTKYSL